MDKVYVKQSEEEPQVEQTNPSSWTKLREISASKSMSLDIEAGMGSCIGAAGADAACGAGKDAAIVAAIEVAIAVSDRWDNEGKRKDRGVD